MNFDFSKPGLLFVQMQDIIITTIAFVIPAYFKWFYHVKIKKDILAFPLSDNAGNKGSLFLHGAEGFNKKDLTVTLLLHGLYGHPCTMLHLAELAQKVDSGPVFSLYLSYDQNKPETHRSLIDKAIVLIETMVKEKLKGLIMAGHSMGAIEAAYRAFVEVDPKIISVISIAGRLKVLPSDARDDCTENFDLSVNQIYAGIQSRPDILLFQLAGDKDWIASLDTTIVRKDKKYSHVIKKAMHLNVLFYPEACEKFLEYLNESQEACNNRPLA